MPRDQLDVVTYDPSRHLLALVVLSPARDVAVVHGLDCLEHGLYDAALGSAA